MLVIISNKYKNHLSREKYFPDTSISNIILYTNDEVTAKYTTTNVEIGSKKIFLPSTTFVVRSLSSLYCKQCGPRTDCSLLGSSLISVHIVFTSKIKIKFELHLNKCSRHKKQMTFSG